MRSLYLILNGVALQKKLMQQKLMQQKVMTQSAMRAEPLIAAGFHALAEPLRLQILDLLRNNELCVCDLCAATDTAQSKLSFHLKVLKAAELVRSRQEGRWIYYSLNLPQFARLEQYLAEYRRFSPIVPAHPCRE